MYPTNRACALAALAAAALMSATSVCAAHEPAREHSGGMKPMAMPADDTPAHFAPTREAYTKAHDFLVKLVGLPEPIPYQKHFTLTFAVFDGHDPSKTLDDARLSLAVGMRHGKTDGFAHGMNSTPRIEDRNGKVAVKGMYFHMMGKWTLEVTVSEGGRQDVAYFDLPCCGA
jgi:hypothetical protein